jgi:hypothetical protein
MSDNSGSDAEADMNHPYRDDPEWEEWYVVKDTYFPAHFLIYIGIQIPESFHSIYEYVLYVCMCMY